MAPRTTFSDQMNRNPPLIIFQVAWAGGASLCRFLNQKHQGHGDHQEQRGRPISQCREDAEQQPTHHWTADRGYLRGRLAQRDCTTQVFGWNKVGQDCLTGRIVERPRGSKQCQQPKIGNVPSAAPSVIARSPSAHQRLDAQTNPDNPATRELVRHWPGDQNQQQRGRKLRQPYQSQIEGIARQLVDLPTNRNGLHLQRKADQNDRHPIEREAAMAQSCKAVLRPHNGSTGA